VDVAALAEAADLTGGEIKKAMVEATRRAAHRREERLGLHTLLVAIPLGARRPLRRRLVPPPGRVRDMFAALTSALTGAERGRGSASRERERDRDRERASRRARHELSCLEIAPTSTRSAMGDAIVEIVPVQSVRSRSRPA
jgi:hypothetical protein